LIVALLVLAALPLAAMTVGAQGSYVCFPTCSETDGRFLAQAGEGNQTLVGQVILLELIADKAATQLEIGIFDGNTSGRWDYTSPGAQSEYTLFMDPVGDGSGIDDPGKLVGTWLGSAMPDNAWYAVTIAANAGARSGSGHYFYTLKVRNTNPGLDSINSFKVRTNGTVILAPQAFSVMAPITSLADAQAIYPTYPSLTGTTYGGTWDFYVNVPGSTPSLIVWDGDLDYGSWDGEFRDTDDPDTPNDVLEPWMVGLQTRYEGVAIGLKNPSLGIDSSGAPPDDYQTATFRREPSISYEVIAPDGRTWLNSNPSGNLEWEKFHVESDYLVPADYHVSGLLPAGVYRIHVFGMDLTNLNAWYFPYKTLCVRPDGTPCGNVDPYLIGDLVWRDTNGDGVNDGKDAGEPGIANVKVNLLDSNGQIIKTTFTDANGIYTFEVAAGTYTVQIPLENFDSGQPLNLLISTTGGESQTNTVTNANILTYDFGYRPRPALPRYIVGDQVWLDSNGNGVYEPELGETGIANVKVNLVNSDGVVIATVYTDANGIYNFPVTPGAYTVQIASENFNNGQPLYGLSSTTGGESQTNTVTNANILTYDFGYRDYIIGDQVWLDSNGNGVYEPELGEIGIANVKVNLISNGQVVATAYTDANGIYQFTVAPGTYTVQVASENFGAGKPLYGLVSTTGGESQTNTVINANILTYDFGYRPRTALGVGTPGYWKNHPEAWPVNSITIGGIVYTKERALYWLGQNDSQDKTITLFRALISAKLNVAIGNQYSCVASTIQAADAWMAAHPVGSGVLASSNDWKIGEPLYLTLDKYNNGGLCAPRRD
jgi:hypothetical protein